VLGRFLEFSIAAPDVQASLDFYTKLGFSQPQAGDAWPHPYAVVTDGRICLGLHQQAEFATSLTFVRPDLLKVIEALEELGVEFEFRHLGNDVFNEVGWFDPSGQLIRLVEARTFSPIERRGAEMPRCGYFSEIALPTPNLETSKLYWERFGFVGLDEPDDHLPHVSCTSDHIDLGLYDAAHLRRPTLRYEVDDIRATLARLAEIGVTPAGEIPPPLRSVPAAVLAAPEGTPLLLAPGSS